MDSIVVKNCLHQLKAGGVVLLPTDGIPGLSWLPNITQAKDLAYAMKGRDLSKPAVHLAANFEAAVSHWSPLPGNWHHVLKNLWPAPLTVIWRRASPSDHSVNPDNTLAIRVPKFSHENLWVGDLLAQLNHPIPSTSVNHSGEPPAQNWQEAVRWVLASQANVFIPELLLIDQNVKQPSTIIALKADGGYTVVRPGALPKERLPQNPC